MLKIGLTGGIGSGKTTVSNIFKNKGIPVIDTDVIAHELTNTERVLNEIITTFGETLLNSDGTLNRKQLAQRVFKSPEDRLKLEAILHPKIQHAIDEKIHRLEKRSPIPRYVIIVIPLLIETDFSKFIERVLVVMADEKDRINRILQRDDRDLDEIRSIISTQATDQQRIDMADDIIKNDHDINDLEIQTQDLHEKYLSLTSAKSGN